MTTLSLAAILAESARRYPDKAALIEGDLQLTFEEAWREARTQAAALAKLGVGPGDRVALMAPNVAHFPLAYYAILAAGAVVVPVHYLLSAEEVTHVLRDSEATLMLCDASRADAAGSGAWAAGIRMVVLGDGGELAEAARSVEPLPTYVTRDADDTAVILYTSGTTGVPKGAMLSHFNLVMNATVNAFDTNDISADDVCFAALPLFHAFGQSCAMNTFWRVGATLVLLPRFDPALAIELMLKERATVFLGVPTMYVYLLKAAANAGELPQLRFCVSGGAGLPVSVLEDFEDTFGTRIYEGYGLSESSPTAATNQAAFGARPGTIGHPVWGVEVEIARADLDDRIDLLPTGQVGEVVVRGHNVFSGYLGRPAETAEALVDGWLRTGDLGAKDIAGFIRILDRKKDMVIRGGYNVYPREVEEVLLRHPDVADVAVIGLPDALYGEEVCAVIVPAPDAAPEAVEIIEWSKNHLAAHKYPRRVEFIDTLPLGASMKVLKRDLRARYAN